MWWVFTKIKQSLWQVLILNGELLKALSLRLRMRQWYPILPFLFSIALEILVSAIRQEKFKWRGPGGFMQGLIHWLKNVTSTQLLSVSLLYLLQYQLHQKVVLVVVKRWLSRAPVATCFLSQRQKERDWDGDCSNIASKRPEIYSDWAVLGHIFIS